MSQKHVFIVLLFAIAVIAGGLALKHLGSAQEDVVRVQVKGGSGTPAIGGPFRLIDHTGQVFTDADLRGRPALVFFGYTQCPDVCPMTMLKITETLELMGKDADAIRPLFVTVDPLRDTPEVVADYIANFHPRFIGLTGTRQQIGTVERAYAVYARAADGAHKETNYLVDHTALVYLLGPDGVFRTFLSQSATPGEMAAKIRQYL